MKRAIFLIALFSLSIFSCSVEPLENDFTLESIETYENYEKSLDIPEGDKVCSRIPLVVEKMKKIVGVIDVSLINGMIELKITAVEGHSLNKTNLGFVNLNNEYLPMLDNGQPDISAFDIIEYHPENLTKVTYYYEDTDLDQNLIHTLVAKVMVIGPQGKVPSWANGTKFNNNGYAMYSYINMGKCRIF